MHFIQISICELTDDLITYEWRHHLLNIFVNIYHANPNSKVHGANMGPTWVLSVPDGPHVGPMNLAIRELFWAHSDGPLSTLKITTRSLSPHLWFLWAIPFSSQSFVGNPFLHNPNIMLATFPENPFGISEPSLWSCVLLGLLQVNFTHIFRVTPLKLGQIYDNPSASEWVIKLNDLSWTADSEVHVVHISRADCVSSLFRFQNDVHI